MYLERGYHTKWNETRYAMHLEFSVYTNRVLQSELMHGVHQLWGGYKCRPISAELKLKIEANVVVSECAVCFRVVAC